MPWSRAAELLASCLQSRDLRALEGRDMEAFGVPDPAREAVLVRDFCPSAFAGRG